MKAKTIFEYSVILLVTILALIALVVAKHALVFMTVIAMVLIIAQMCRYYWFDYDSKLLRQLIVEKEQAIARYLNTISGKDSQLVASEKEIQFCKERIRTLQQEKKSYEHQIVGMEFPRIKITHNKPSLGSRYFRLYQGKDANWYFSLVGTKGKYIFLGKPYPTHAEAVQSFLELITYGKQMMLFDEMQSFPNTTEVISLRDSQF